MRKILIGLMAGLIITSFSVAIAAPNGQPFQELEKAIDELWVAINNIELIPGPPGPQGEKGEKGDPGSTLHLIDGNGQDLGLLISVLNENIGEITREDVISFGYEGFVVFNSQTGSILNFTNNFNTKTSSLSAGEFGGVRYTELNCEGLAYNINTSNRLSPTIIIRPTNGKLYKYAGGSIENVTFKSYSGGGQNCINEERRLSGYQLTEIILPFNEPLAWPLQIIEM